MITTPNRLADVVRALENGEPVDLNRVAALQALDLAVAGRQFVEQAIRDHEAADERFKAAFSDGQRHSAGE